MSELERLSAAVRQTRAHKESLEMEIKAVNADLEVIENELLSVMGNHGLASFKNEDGTLFTASSRLFASVADPEAALPWLRSHGLGSLIRETVHSGTLSSALKELMGSVEIPESIRIFEKPTLSIRRGRLAPTGS